MQIQHSIAMGRCTLMRNIYMVYWFKIILKNNFVLGQVQSYCTFESMTEFSKLMR